MVTSTTFRPSSAYTASIQSPFVRVPGVGAVLVHPPHTVKRIPHGGRARDVVEPDLHRVLGEVALHRNGEVVPLGRAERRVEPPKQRVVLGVGPAALVMATPLVRARRAL